MTQYTVVKIDQQDVLAETSGDGFFRSQHVSSDMSVPRVGHVLLYHQPVKSADPMKRVGGGEAQLILVLVENRTFGGVEDSLQQASTAIETWRETSILDAERFRGSHDS